MKPISIAVIAALLCAVILAVRFGADTLVIMAFLVLAGVAIYFSAAAWLDLRGKKIAQDATKLESLKIHADNAALLIPGAGLIPIPNSRYAGAGLPGLIAPIAPVLPGPEPTIYKPLTLAETLASLPRNQLALCFGIDPVTGREEVSNLQGTMHTMIGASTGMGKSSLLAGLLAQLVTANRPGLFGMYICDAKRTTGRWFENSAQRVAYSLEDILATVKQVDLELHRRMAGMLLDEQPIILVIEEALATRKMFARLDDRKAALNAFTGYLDELALMGREFGCFLYWCSQVDYATSELQDVRGQFAARLAGSLMPTAAQSMGFQSKELVKQLWEQRTPGQFLIESPAGSRLILAPRLNLRNGELASYLQGSTTATATRERTQSGPGDYGSSAPAGRETSRPVTAQFREISTSTATSYYDLLPSASDKLRALSAWNQGANSVRKLATALQITEYQARQLIEQLDREGLIIRAKKGV